MRNQLSHFGRQGRRVVSDFVVTAFAQEDAETAKAQWRQVADQLRLKAHKLATLIDNAEADILAYMTFPKVRRTKSHSTSPLERLNGEIKQRANVVGVRPAVLPLEDPLLRLTPQRGRHRPTGRRAILVDRNDEWVAQTARYMTLETIATVSDNALIELPAVAA